MKEATHRSPLLSFSSSWQRVSKDAVAPLLTFFSSHTNIFNIKNLKGETRRPGRPDLEGWGLRWALIKPTVSWGQKRGPRAAGSTALPRKHNGQTEKLTAGTAPSLEDITPSPRLTNPPRGSGQTNATPALLSAPGCGACAVRAAQLGSERPLPPGGFRGGCCPSESRDEPPSRAPETPPPDCAVGPWGLGVGVEPQPGLRAPSLSFNVHLPFSTQHDEWSF